jgi:hypothetical protein
MSGTVNSVVDVAINANGVMVEGCRTAIAERADDPVAYVKPPEVEDPMGTEMRVSPSSKAGASRGSVLPRCV